MMKLHPYLCAKWLKIDDIIRATKKTMFDSDTGHAAAFRAECDRGMYPDPSSTQSFLLFLQSRQLIRGLIFDGEDIITV